jgi:hypothetical protein
MRDRLDSSPMRRGHLVLALAVAGVVASCGGDGPRCDLSGGVITCVGETFDECANAGCSFADRTCDPSAGCHISPNIILAHDEEKPPNDSYLCEHTSTCSSQCSCGTWTEATCQVTVTTDSYQSTVYTVVDPTCPP